MMKIHTPSNSRELLEILNSYPSNEYMFRGLEDDERMTLTASLQYYNPERKDYDTLLDEYESTLLKAMPESVPEYLDETACDWDIRFRQRHLGGASPIMDWTIDPEVSIFFATYKNQPPRKACIYILSTNRIDYYNSDELSENYLLRKRYSSIPEMAIINGPLFAGNDEIASHAQRNWSRQFGRFLVQKENFWAVSLLDSQHPLNDLIVAKVILTPDLVNLERKRQLDNGRYTAGFLLNGDSNVIS